MNTDIRVSVEFWDHPKTLKLIRQLGLEAPVALQRLWMYAAKFRPDGVLIDLDLQDIAEAARWSGGAERLVRTLLDLGWLNFENEVYVLHDWPEHQPWACKSKERSDAARIAGKASGEARRAKNSAEEPLNGLRTDRSKTVERIANGLRTPRTPSPSPSPKPKEKTNTPTECCPEPPKNGAAGPPSPGALLTIPLAGKYQEHPVYQTDIERWQGLFPAVEVPACLRRIENYFRLEKPEKRKTAKGIERCIVTWLAREQDKGGGIFKRAPPNGGSAEGAEFDEAEWARKANERAVP